LLGTLRADINKVRVYNFIERTFIERKVGSNPDIGPTSPQGFRAVLRLVVDNPRCLCERTKTRYNAL
jgi:hypothetical protein